MPEKRARKRFKTKIPIRLHVVPALSAFWIGYHQSRAVVIAFEKKAAATRLATSLVWRFHAFAFLLIGLFQKQEICNPRANGIRLLAERLPQIEGAAHRFLGAVVEIIAEGRTDLRFRFERGDQLAI